MAKAGKILGLISPILALGTAALILFGTGYSYEFASCGAGYGHPSSEVCTHESGRISVFREAMEEGDRAPFLWAAFIFVVCLIAGLSVLAGKIAPIWVCAIGLWLLAGLGMMSIGLFIVPLAVVLFTSATLLTVARN
jgi:hypothetical protein